VVLHTETQEQEKRKKEKSELLRWGKILVGGETGGYW